jgi:hypothetical protein
MSLLVGTDPPGSSSGVVMPALPLVRARALVGALLAALVAVGLLSAPASAATGTVTGSVVDTTGEPVVGSRVVAYRVSAGSGDVAEVARTTVTGTGSFSLRLPEGSYRLFFSGLPQHVPEYWKDAPSVYSGRAVTVRGGATTSGIATELTIGQGLRGRVVDESGKPVPDTLVSVYDYSTGEYTGEQAADASTDEDGWFRIYPLPAGTYRVHLAPTWLRWEFWRDARTIGQGEDVVVPAEGAAQIEAEVEPWTRNTARPEITGTPRVGSPMEASLGEWTHMSDIRFSYQWRMDGTAIDAGKQATYTPSPGTVGKRLTVTVTATHGGDVVARATSLATEPVQRGVIEVVRPPTLTGSHTVGSSLTVDRGYWRPSGLTWSYVWTRDGVAIPRSTPGSRGPTYTLTAADWGKQVRVRVSAERSGYTTVRRYTEAVAITRKPSMSVVATQVGPGLVRLTTTVKVVGSSNPSGSIDIREGGESVGGAGRLSGGRAVLTLDEQAPGDHTYTVVYSGNRLVEPTSRSRTVTVR